jgi:phosphatidylglycerol---prolipoprotein diacylglyceryl transferase
LGHYPGTPSQIYEAIAKGLILFLVLLAGIYRWKRVKRPGAVSSLFLLGYGLARCFCEFFREDTDAKIGLGLMTSGQIYSLPMIILGAGYFGIEMTACPSELR